MIRVEAEMEITMASLGRERRLKSICSKAKNNSPAPPHLGVFAFHSPAKLNGKVWTKSVADLRLLVRLDTYLEKSV